ncbi:metallophosphoesterase [Clostridium sp. P21]|uniref:Metallophosphoesterase n=1 Tax=Clostridium muellerianum TaxID=2716538 RepID=A0A7Y0EG76_9CLOT|nr:metallophosphoesterase [Clostridium muellerianum]NMM62848.1 metallophosphoesterase [Clostridium muellerianum]
MRILIFIGTILLLLFFLFLYIMSCYYIGIKGKGVLSYKNKKIRSKLYWFIFWTLALSYIISVLLRSFLSVNNLFTSIFTAVGVICLAITFYLIIVFPIVDIMKFILRKIGYKGKVRNYLSRLYGNGLSVFLVVFIIIGFGLWNANHVMITNYDLTINKKAGKVTSLNVVMIADVHMGIGIKEKGIDKMVNSINALNPDIVFFCGDIMDESSTTKLKSYASNAFKNIKSKYGVYGVTGNHEYIEKNLPETLYYLKNGNVKMLQDTAVKIDNSFYVVGRNDPAGIDREKEGIKPLSKILKDSNRELPIIVLNHRPTNLEEDEKEKVDIQLSGHTHKGQFFPNNFITKMVYEDDYGYLKRNNFNLIVTSGYGTWGPPIRIGTKAEIVNVKIKFRHLKENN